MKELKIFNTLIKNAVVFGVIIVIAGLSFSGLLSRVLDKTVMSGVHSGSGRYLEKAQERAVVVFAVLSSYKAVISVIKESGIGIKIGYAVEPIDDFVDIAWKVVLVSIVALIVQQMLIGSFSSMVFSFLFAGGMLFLLITEIMKQLKKEAFVAFSKKLAHVMLLFALIIYILVPLLIWSGNAVADKITISHTNNSIEVIKADIDEIKSLNVFTFRIDKLAKEVVLRVKDLIVHSSTALFWLIACYIISGAILPLLIFITLYFILKLTWIKTIG